MSLAFALFTNFLRSLDWIFQEHTIPTLNWLILYFPGSVGQDALHYYQSLNDLFKNISFVDIDVTMATIQ